jgi:hypothetical protein
MLEFSELIDGFRFIIKPSGHAITFIRATSVCELYESDTHKIRECEGLVKERAVTTLSRVLAPYATTAAALREQIYARFRITYSQKIELDGVHEDFLHKKKRRKLVCIGGTVIGTKY